MGAAGRPVERTDQMLRLSTGFVEDYTFATKLRGEPPAGMWDAANWDADPDWEFTSAAGETPEQLYTLWDDAVERSRARLQNALAHGGLDQLVDVSSPDGHHASLRRRVCDLSEEYGRHTGHADLLREAVDGRVGEDPPVDWRPGVLGSRGRYPTRSSGSRTNVCSLTWRSSRPASRSRIEPSASHPHEFKNDRIGSSDAKTQQTSWSISSS